MFGSKRKPLHEIDSKLSRLFLDEVQMYECKSLIANSKLGLSLGVD